MFAAASRQEWDGSHLAVHWNTERLRVHTDFFRTLPLLYTSGGRMAAVSDAWQLLVQLLTALGLPVTLSPQTVLAMRIDSSITEHRRNEQTACSQVRLASVATHVVVPPTPEGANEVRVEQTRYPEAFAAPSGT